MNKHWEHLSSNNELAQQFQQFNSNLPLTICRILTQRKIEDNNQLKNYLCPDFNELHDPFNMLGMQASCDRIEQAIEQQEKILIIGDYDVDGTTSVAVLYMFLSSFYHQVDYYIPNRFTEGYGVSDAAIDYAIQNNFKLIITVDCGIKSFNHIQRAKDAGIETIISDHHLPTENLPPAFAILNPKQPNCNYPYKDLCGCGIVFKLVSAIADRKNISENDYKKYVDLVALAIAADIVPILDENRILCKLGLEQINQRQANYGIQALLEVAKLDEEIKVKHLVFVIAPRINAAGRISNAKTAVKLFLSPDLQSAKEQAQLLNENNDERRSLDQETFVQAQGLILKDKEFTDKKATVLYCPDWNKGVIGIVASRLIELYYRPTLVFTKSSDDKISGSARSIDGFNIYEAIASCHSYLENYGGHFAAAGLTLKLANYESFKKKFEDYAAEHLLPSQLQPTIKINTDIEFEQITEEFYNQLLRLEPFGTENMEPIFYTTEVCDTGYSKIVKGHHIYFTMRKNDCLLSGIGFNLAAKFSIVKSKKPFSIVYKIKREPYKGVQHLKLHILDLKTHL